MKLLEIRDLWQADGPLQGRAGVHKTHTHIKHGFNLKSGGCDLHGLLPAERRLVAAGKQSMQGEFVFPFFQSSVWVLYSQSGAGLFCGLRHWKCCVPVFSFLVQRLLIPSSLPTPPSILTSSSCFCTFHAFIWCSVCLPCARPCVEH